MARKLNLLNKDGALARQRVWNWTRDGIPPAIELEHIEYFRRLKRQALGA